MSEPGYRELWVVGVVGCFEGVTEVQEGVFKGDNLAEPYRYMPVFESLLSAQAYADWVGECGPRVQVTKILIGPALGEPGELQKAYQSRVAQEGSPCPPE